jgi:hypothetical protein
VVGCRSRRAELSPEEPAKLAQNPVGNLTNVPFQNDTNFNYGPLEGTQSILNIQPVTGGRDLAICSADQEREHVTQVMTKNSPPSSEQPLPGRMVRAR